MTTNQKTFWLLAAILAGILAIVLSGCSGTSTPKLRIQETTNNLPPVWPSSNEATNTTATLAARAVQPVRDPGLPGSQSVPGMGIVPTAPTQKIVTVYWENPKGVPKQYPFANRFWSGLEATSDYVTWQEVARVPFQPWCSARLTNPPSPQFYRAVSGLKQ